MTAALEHLCGPALRARGARLFGALALALPIPAMAALGLSLPLPATVERLAAKLVPFGHADLLDARTSPARGSIVLAPAERAAKRPAASTATGLPLTSLRSRAVRGSHAPEARPAGARSAAAETRDETAAPGQAPVSARPESPRGGTSSPAPSGGGSNGGSNGGSSGGDTGGGTTTTPGGTPPAPAPSPVDTATNTANGAVETATNTATTATDTATKAADSAATTVSNTVGGLKPP